MNSFRKKQFIVFISSRMDGIYETLRSDLRYMLESTGLISVFSFESTLGSSQTALENYINGVDEAHVCVFLVINGDTPSDGVLQEQERARKKFKKCIYVFCDEKDKNPTNMQNTLVENKGEKFVKADKISQMVPLAYESILDDLVSNYMYRTGTQMQDSDSRIGIDEVAKLKFTTFDKSMLSGFDKTTLRLTKLLSFYPQEVKNTSELDESSVRTLEYFLCLEQFDGETYSSITTAILNLYPNELKQFIKHKLNALKNFIIGDLQGSIDEIKESISIGQNQKNFPQWMLNLAASDLRSVQYILDWNNNVLRFGNEGQKILDESDEPLYSPLIDKELSALRGELLKINNYSQLDSPYTFRSGGAESILAKVASSFYLSLYLVSINQLNSIKYVLTDVLTTFSLLYQDVGIHTEFITLLILENNKKDLENFLRKAILSEDIMTDNNIQVCISRIQRLQFETAKTQSLACLLSFFGYCFSDDLFRMTTKYIFTKFNSWKLEENRDRKLESSFLDVIENTQMRLPPETICLACIQLINSEQTVDINRCLKILSNTSLVKVEREIQQQINSTLISLLNDDKQRNSLSNLHNAILNFRFNTIINPDDLDLAVQNSDQRFYTHYYSSLEDRQDARARKIIIQDLTDQIQRENQTQGKDGLYVVYSRDAVKELIHQVARSKIKLTKASTQKIVKTTIERLLDPNKTIKSKEEAILLLVILRNRYPIVGYWEKIVHELNTNKDLILKGVEDFLFYQGSIELLKFHLAFLLSSFEKIALLDLVIRTSNFDDGDLISALYLLNMDIVTAPREFSADYLKDLFIISLNSLKRKELEIKNLSISLLINLSTSIYQDEVIKELTVTFDQSTPKSRAYIISNLKRNKLRHANISSLDYLFQKGKLDPNYQVRLAAS